MRESKLAELKELASSLTSRDTMIKKSLCDIFLAIRDSSLSDDQKLRQVKQIIDGCQQEVHKMVGMSIQSL
jgi:hypothetical protein